ncbi:MAG: hypothetical protein COV10_01790 [Candidatus Vogelbacteria bacterium CG10_big_fil_rev_8_21_14_0_10_51_16]|uniref:Uncharacterized protein n=1 Tax=Candidatus Vogelbacteria bacterium CG10_big_fil_rev_8_21_14_0_10_51_16 TaxID=1975045 RepID=A0A2H0RGS5_9BACT|nr:MAG: hypothetical protein COV10_01790 [Candidatus Vogelbacteria bacterium CG10_big_fil_rev_8_21_14_0_10_51_16]
MSSWSRGRQFSYFFTILVVLSVASLGTWYIRSAEPTCFDGVKNQDEQGVDCGGICELVCRDFASVPIVFWSQVFPVRAGYVDVAALVVNPNTSFEARVVPYRFIVYDKKDRLVAERAGTTFLLPGEKVVLFEPLLDVKERDVARTFLEISPGRALVWENAGKGRVASLSFVNPVITVEEGIRLTGVIKNESAFVAKEVVATAVLDDASGNVLGVSTTKLSRLGALAEEAVTFTWPASFERPVTSSNVYLHVPRE